MQVTATYKPTVECIYEIGRVLYYPNFIVVQLNEGVHVTKENMEAPLQMVKELFGTDIPFVYISHRINSYSIDPMRYTDLIKQFPNFKGFAVVSDNYQRRMLVYLEKLFIRRPTEVFCDMDRAFEWADNLMGNEKT